MQIKQYDDLKNRTAYHDLEQLLQCEYKNLYSEYFGEDEEEEEE